ncbi:LamG domain-containing protein [Niabella sp. CC-SYL272]|uniref:LamG domain-containing protein n=1 Tax=Niabella agricola TaxID=2891571 RepID=UPI001F224BB2|nr:LamG domain-containing protein [Niabella agricola]MCF3110818.1 LamG domain-containing protein [Niabella agricola]
MKKQIIDSILGISSCLVFAACQKMDRPVLGQYPSDTPVTPATPLRFYVPFDSMNSESATKLSYRFADSISANPSFPASKDLSFVQGIHGTSLKGANGTALKYVNANDMKTATSFSVALWIKQSADAATGRTEFYFSLMDDSYGWSHSALFMMIEHATASAATLKVGVMDQWMEFPDGNQLKKPILDGNWHHLVICYDETTSKMSYYFDGTLVAGAPSSATDVKNNGNPRGKLDFSKTSYLVIGGWNAQVGLAGPTDDWVKSYTGALDQFRMYNKVLSATEVADLYNGKK